VTMISGTVDLSSFFVSQVVGGNYYSQTFTVPEPTTTTLIIGGFGLLFVIRDRIRRPFSFTFVVRQIGYRRLRLEF
jgi:hypothetical protein